MTTPTNASPFTFEDTGSSLFVQYKGIDIIGLWYGAEHGEQFLSIVDPSQFDDYDSDSLDVSWGLGSQTSIPFDEIIEAAERHHQRFQAAETERQLRDQFKAGLAAAAEAADSNDTKIGALLDACEAAAALLGEKGLTDDLGAT